MIIILHHDLEIRDKCRFGVRRYNPELKQWEYFSWYHGAWRGYKVREDSKDFERFQEHYLEVSYEETWCDPVETE